MKSRRIRDFGVVPGRLPAGEKNSIADVPGVRVGHWTCRNERHQTGVTVVIPRQQIFLHKCTAAVHVINGYGKSAGLVQIEELGQLETPVALTNTLNVGKVSDALVQYTIGELEKTGKKLRSLNPVVGECNDASLNEITDRNAGYDQVAEAIMQASDTFEQGSVGAGTGMTCHDLKGGIGSASRIIKIGRNIFTLGVLLLCNHGNLQDLRVNGKLVGPEIGKRIRAEQKEQKKAGQEESPAGTSADYSEDVGSCIIVLATDLPVSSRQLKRILRRSGVGLARCGSYWGHGSGDIAIGFTTAHDIAEDETKSVVSRKMLNERYLEIAFLAAAEACEEAVLNALAAAEPVKLKDGSVRRALREFAELIKE